MSTESIPEGVTIAIAPELAAIRILAESAESRTEGNLPVLDWVMPNLPMCEAVADVVALLGRELSSVMHSKGFRLRVAA